MPITGATLVSPNFGYWAGDTSGITVDGVFTASVQTIAGSSTEFTSVSGDVLQASDTGLTMLGADDFINVAAWYVFGDALRAGENALRVVGGDDRISMIENPFYTPGGSGPVRYFVIGDSGSVLSELIGGNDRIIGFRTEDMPSQFTGDAESVGDRLDVNINAFAKGGRDVIKATNAKDTIIGDFNEVFSGATADYGNDRIWGYGGDDLIYGDARTVFDDFSKAGADKIFGGAGNDTIYGDVGTVRHDNSSRPVEVSGKAKPGGDDKIDGGSGEDTIYGGGGADLIRGGKGGDDIFGGWGSDDINGDNGNDILWGEQGNDLLKGGRGNDILIGDAGKDDLRGGRGDDVLVFNGGKDVGTGGAGADTFSFTDYSPDGHGKWDVVIKDFSITQGDKLKFKFVAEITDWNDLKTNNLTSAANGDAIIYTDLGVEQVRLVGIGVADLGAGDFLF